MIKFGDHLLDSFEDMWKKKFVRLILDYVRIKTFWDVDTFGNWSVTSYPTSMLKMKKIVRAVLKIRPKKLIFDTNSGLSQY